MTVTATAEPADKKKNRRSSLNAVARMELARRFRGARAFGMLTTYIAIVTGLALVFYVGAALSLSSSAIGAARNVGVGLFYILTGLLVVLVCFIGPAFAVGSISGERERATLDVLRVTPLSAWQIVWAKFMSAFGFVLLMILATLPMCVLCVIIGGVEAAQLAVVMVTVVAAGFAFTALALLFSAYSRSQLGATIVTYAVVLVVVAGTAVFSLVLAPALQSARTSAAASASEAGLFISQLILIGLSSISPISALVAAELNFQARGDLFTVRLDPLPGVPASAVPALPAPFLILSLLYVVLGVVLLVLASRRLGRADSA